MIEILFVLFLFSGLVKSVLYTFNIHLPVDFSLLTAFFLLIFTCIEIIKQFKQDDDFLKKLKLRVKSFWPFILFCLVILISLTYTHSEHYAYVKVFKFATVVLAFTIPLIVRLNFNRIFSTLTYVTLIFAPFVFVLLPYSLYSDPNDFSLSIEKIEHASALFGIMSGILLIFYALKKRKSLWSILMINILLYFLLYSLSRGAIIFSILIVLLVDLYYIISALINKKKVSSSRNTFKMKKVMISMVVLFILNAAAMYSINQNENVSNVFKRSLNRMHLIETTADVDEPVTYEEYNKVQESKNVEGDVEVEKAKRNKSIIARKMHIRFSLEKITASTSSFIFGYGIGSYRFLLMGEDGRGFPHNLFLEVMFEMGLLGLVALIFILFYAFKNIKITPVYIIAITLFLFLNAMKSSALTDLRVLFAFLSILTFQHFFFKTKDFSE